MTFYTKYNHARPKVAKHSLPSATDAQYAKDCDINVVVGKFLRGAGIDVVDHSKDASFGDVSAFSDFQQMMSIVDRGKRAFMSVPSEIRARFGNDPVAFFRFCNDPANAHELVRLGLAEYVKNGDSGALPKSVAPDHLTNISATDTKSVTPNNDKE